MNSAIRCATEKAPKARSKTVALVILVLAVLFLLTAAADLHAQTSLSIGNTPGYPGTTVAVPIQVTKATNIVGAQFDVAFNAARLSSGTPTLTGANAGQTIRSREVAPGVRRTVVYSLNTALPRTNGFIATMPFRVAPEERVSSGPLVPQNVKLAGRDAGQIAPVTLNSGTIFVRPVNPLPDGLVQFFLPSEQDERYLIQATTNFENWVTLTNLTATGDFMDLVDADAARYPFRFYRWVLYDAAGEIGAVTQLPGGKFSFQFDGLPGRAYVLQASSDLQAWADLSTNVATTGTLNFTNLIDANFPKRFFRLKSE